MEHIALAAIAVLIIGYGLISRWLEHTVITGPIVFVAFGLLLSPLALGVIHLEPDSEVINLIANATLIVVLFADASRIKLGLIRREGDIPLRLLTVGLALTMVGGAVVAWLIFGDLNLLQAAVLAIILSPTDAALGQVVVSSERVPTRIRTALNVESGLNDGIALPFLLLFIALATSGEHSNDAAYWVNFTSRQLILGPLIGAAVGYFGGRLVQFGAQRELMEITFQKLSMVGLAILAFTLAETVHGNGFMAVFIAGMFFGNSTTEKVCGRVYEFAEVEGSLLVLLTFMLFGSVFVSDVLLSLSWQMVVYALLSLTVIRMVPVALCLIGKGFERSTVLFLGWFGPRGAASILYILLVLDATDMPQREIVVHTATLTILLSVVLHGLSALPGVNRYVNALESAEDMDSMPEMAEVTPMATRVIY